MGFSLIGLVLGDAVIVEMLRLGVLRGVVLSIGLG